MDKSSIFFVLACSLLVFSIITICTAPIITGTLDTDGWSTLNCQFYSDYHKEVEDSNSISNKDYTLKFLDKAKNFCNRKKAMYGLEYASLISDLVLGFICALLALLHFFGIGKSFEKITGIIGLICGIIGFILTLVYIIYSGYIFTNDGPSKRYDYDSGSLRTYSTSTFIPKLDKDRKFAKLKDGKYECFEKGDEEDSFFAKYKDLGKRQYNYNKDLNNLEQNSEYYTCYYRGGYYNLFDKCKNSNFDSGDMVGSNCQYLYIKNTGLDNIYYKYLYDKWITTIIFGCFIIAINLGLAIFGFLLFKEGNSGI